MSLGCVKGRDGVSSRSRIEEPAAFNISPSTPEGLSEITHMGREISNLQGIFGGFQLPKMLLTEAGVITLGTGAAMA